VEPNPSIGRVPQLGDYAAVLRARKWLVISITLLALVGAGTYLAVRTPVYSSSSEIQIFPTDEGLGTTVDLETEARIASSLSVAGLALPKLGDTFGSAEGLLEHVSVTLPSEAAILTITFTHTDRGVAVKGAEAVADSYLVYKATQASNHVTTQLANLEAQAVELRLRETELLEIIANPPTPSDRLAAQAELAGVRTNLTVIAEQKLALENDQPPAGQQLGPPSTAKLASPGLPLVLIAAGVLGLILGSILAFIIEGLTGRVREAEEVEQELGSAVLGMVPVMHLKRTRGRLPVVSRDAPSEPAAEAFRLLRSGFLFSAGPDERVVMVTSPGVGDGKSTTAANLAVALAQAGHRTILVGGDLRRSDMHTLFGIPNDTGLVHVLEGRSRPTPLPTDVENLRIIASGPPTEISAHLFETEAFPEALAILREQAEYVVVDAPPLAISDPLLMVPSVDYVLFVVDAGKATRRALRRTRELLQRIGLPRMGVVLNRSKSPWGPSGTRAYYYYKKGKAAGVPTLAQEVVPQETTPVAPVESKPVVSTPVAESKQVESKQVESKQVAESKPAEPKRVASTPVAESKPAEPKQVESTPVAESAGAEKPKPTPGITPDAKSRPAAAAKATPPAATAVPASAAPPAQQAPAEPPVKAEPAATPARPVAAPAEAAESAPAGSEATPAAPPVPVESSTPVPPVPVATVSPAPPAPATPPALETPPTPDTPPVPEPSGEQAAEPVTDAMPEPVVEPASRNGGRASKRSGSRKRRSGSRGRSRPSGG
jgi:tyrosine-protein kinase